MVPFVREFDFAYGRADRLSPLITRVIANNPGPFTFAGSGTYLVGDERGVAIIDPGPADEAHGRAVLAAAPGPVTHILVTHTHLDHSGGTDFLKKETGVNALAFGKHPSTKENAPIALDEGGDFGFAPDRTLADGEKIELPVATLEAVHTPGHCANHLCFALLEENALFTGDHIMGWATTVVAPPDGDMDEYYESLDLLLARNDRIYYPTHGAPIPNPREFVLAVKAHRDRRDTAILAALTGELQSPIEIARTVYTDIDPKMHFAAALNVKAHLDRHVRRGTVVTDGKGYARA